MRYSCGHAFSEREGVAAHEVGTLSIGIIECVEKEGGRRGQKVAYVLLECIYLFARRLGGDEAVVVYGVDVPLLRDLQSPQANLGTGRSIRSPLRPGPQPWRCESSVLAAQIGHTARASHHVAETPAGRIFEGDARGSRAEDALDVLAGV